MIDMSYDGTLLRKVTNELQDKLSSGRITKIYQLSSYDLLWMIHANNEKHQLLISASPNYARIHLTNSKKERPDTPPQFCMFLRKHLEGGIIESITQKDNDRVLTMDILTRNELGDKVTKKCIVEVTGRHANIIVTDPSMKILDAIKHNMPFDGSERTIFPSAIYQYPPTDKLDPFIKDTTIQVLNKQDDVSPKWLLDTFMGLSPLCANEIIHRREQGQPLAQAFFTVLDDTNYTLIESKKDYFYYTDLKSISGPRKHFASANELLDRYYYERDTIDILRQKSKDILKLIKNNIDKQAHKAEKLSRDLRNTNKRENFKIKGELIQANLYNIKKGDTLLQTINYYTNEAIDISLDPKKDARQNMESYYKKYKKLKASIPHLERQIDLAKKEKAYFEELLHQLDYTTIKDIEEIKEELEVNGYLKNKNKTKKKKKNKPNYDTFYDADGVEILVGKNNIQNDYLTHKLAHHTDTWMHVKNATGSHVIVRQKDDLSETTIRTAAQLAAYYSVMRHSSSVAVDYTLVRNLKKVPGKKGSYVTFKQNKTIYIDPDEEFIIQLKKK